MPNNYGANLISDILFDTLTTKVPDQTVDRLKEAIDKAVKSNRRPEAIEWAIGKIFIAAVESAHGYQNQN